MTSVWLVIFEDWCKCTCSKYHKMPKNLGKKNVFFVGSWKPLTKKSTIRIQIRHCKSVYGSKDPNPSKNVTDPAHWFMLNQRPCISFYTAIGAMTKSSWNWPISCWEDFLDIQLSRNCPFNTQDYRTRRPCCRRLWSCPSSCPTSSRGSAGPGRASSWSDLQVCLDDIR